MSILHLFSEMQPDLHLPTLTKDMSLKHSCSDQLAINYLPTLLRTGLAESLPYDRNKYLFAEMLV